MLRALLIALLAAVSTVVLAADPNPVVTYTKQAKFEDVRDDLKMAIEGKGLVIDYQSHLNSMLERTGKDVGSAQKLFVDAQAFVFCSASLSRKMMRRTRPMWRCALMQWLSTQPRRSRARSTSRIAVRGVPTDPLHPRRH